MMTMSSVDILAIILTEGETTVIAEALEMVGEEETNQEERD